MTGTEFFFGYEANLECGKLSDYLFLTKIVYKPTEKTEVICELCSTHFWYTITCTCIKKSLWACVNTSANFKKFKPLLLFSLSCSVSWYASYHIIGIMICTEFAKYSIVPALFPSLLLLDCHMIISILKMEKIL